MALQILLGLVSAVLAGYTDESWDHNQEAEKLSEEFDFYRSENRPYYLPEENFPLHLDSDEHVALDYSLWNEYGAQSYGGKGKGKSSKKGKGGGKGGKGWGRRK